MRSSEDKQENLKKSIDFIDEAASKNAHLVCFPEFQMAFSPSSQSANHLARIAETVKGNFVLTLAAAALNHIVVYPTQFVMIHGQH